MMFLFHPIHFLKFLVKSQPRRPYKKGSCIKKKSVCQIDDINIVVKIKDQYPPLDKVSSCE